MTGQGNIMENRLSDLTREIQFLEKIKDKLPVWSKTRHQMENVLELNYRERRNILQQKKAVK